jgi:hypothetical protein
MRTGHTGIMSHERTLLYSPYRRRFKTRAKSGRLQQAHRMEHYTIPTGTVPFKWREETSAGRSAKTGNRIMT